MDEKENKKEYFKSTLELVNQNVQGNRRQAEYVTFAISAGSLTLLVGIFGNFAPETICEKIVLALSAIFSFSALLIYLYSVKHSASYNSKVALKLFKWQDSNYQGGFLLPEDHWWWKSRREDFSYIEDDVATFASIVGALILFVYVIYKIFI